MINSENKSTLEPPKWMHYAINALGVAIVVAYVWIAYETIKDIRERKNNNRLEMITNEFNQVNN
jgi:hypothetical protein